MEEDATGAVHGKTGKSRAQRAREEPEIDVQPVEPASIAPPRYELLQGADPESILARISQGDPLRLCALVGKRLRERSLMIDPDRVHEKSLAVMALAAARATEPQLDLEWVLKALDLAIERVLREDREEERVAAGCPPENPAHYAFIHLAFATEPGMTRSAAVAFNDLPPLARRAFYALLVEGKSVEECLEEGLGPREFLRMNILQSLKALGHIRSGERVGGTLVE